MNLINFGIQFYASFFFFLSSASFFSYFCCCYSWHHLLAFAFNTDSLSIIIATNVNVQKFVIFPLSLSLFISVFHFDPNEFVCLYQ